MSHLKNKKAIITGGGRGLGKATAIAFAKEGIDIAITGRNEEILKNTVAELETYGVKAIYAVFDVGNYEEVKTSIKDLIDRLGTVNILVNNAGVGGFGTFTEMPVEQWTEIIQTNLMGMYYVTKEVLPYLIANNEGDIEIFHRILALFCRSKLFYIFFFVFAREGNAAFRFLRGTGAFFVGALFMLQCRDSLIHKFRGK